MLKPLNVADPWVLKAGCQSLTHGGNPGVGYQIRWGVEGVPCEVSKGSQSLSWVRMVTTRGATPYRVLNSKQDQEDIHLEDILTWGGRTQER